MSRCGVRAGAVFDFPYRPESPGGIIDGEDFLQPEGGLGTDIVTAQSRSMRRAQALSMARPPRPLTCWERFCIVSVMARLASEVKWKR